MTLTMRNPSVRSKLLLGKAFALACASAVVFSTSCASSQSGSTNTGPVEIGLGISLSGLYYAAGAGEVEGATLAAKAVNDAGGVLGGRKLDLVIGDDHTDPVDSIALLQKMISLNHIVAGFTSTPMIQAQQRYYDAAHIPVLITGGSDTEPRITDPLMWRLTPGDSQLGTAMALYAIKAGYKHPAMLFDTGDNGKALGAQVRAAWAKNAPGNPIAAEIDYAPGQTSYRSEILTLVNSHPDSIVFRISVQDAGAMFSALRELNGLSLPMVGDDSSGTPDFINAIGLPTSEKVVTTMDTGAITGPGVDYFNTNYQTFNGHPPLTQSQYSYDAVILYALAIQKAGSTDGMAIAHAIPLVTDPKNTPVYTAADGLAALKAGKDVKYVGVGSDLSYDQFHQVYGPFAGYQATDNAGGRKLLLNITAADISTATPRS